MELLQEIRAGQRYVKCPVAVPVRFAVDSGVLTTREGPVSYAQGDALLTGVEGEQWPIERGRFEITYEPCCPTQYGENGLYIKKLAVVHAVRNKTARHVPLGSAGQMIQAKPGDWLVADATDSVWVVADTIFEATYMVATDGL